MSNKISVIENYEFFPRIEDDSPKRYGTYSIIMQSIMLMGFILYSPCVILLETRDIYLLITSKYRIIIKIFIKSVSRCTKDVVPNRIVMHDAAKMNGM